MVKQFSTPITKEHRKRFGLWCIMNGWTQQQGLAHLIENHVPELKIEPVQIEGQ